MPTLFQPPKYSVCPSPTTIEVSLFGPGYGECAVVHLGDGKWVVVDSFEAKGHRAPVASLYLKDLGLSPKDGIYAIVASHWDDDHIRGIAKLLEECPNARFVTSAAFGRQDFLKFAMAYNNPGTLRQSPGTMEIIAALGAAVGRTEWATNAKSIVANGFLNLSHGHGVTLSTLSPSNAELTRFLQWVAASMPISLQPRRAAPKASRNDLSVVVWLTVGTQSVLLGGDLEEHGGQMYGWSAIVGDPGRPPGTAHIFKIPHHGSSTGHHLPTWQHMVRTDAFSILAPWRKGGKALPTKADAARILSHSALAYSTNTLAPPKPMKRGTKAGKIVSRIGPKVARQAIDQMGMIRLRMDLMEASPAWSIELFGAAEHLSSI